MRFFFVQNANVYEHMEAGLGDYLREPESKQKDIEYVLRTAKANRVKLLWPTLLR